MMKVLIRDEMMAGGFDEVMDECPVALRSKLLELPIVQLWLDNRDNTELEEFVFDAEAEEEQEERHLLRSSGVIPKEESCSLPYLIWLIERSACSDATIYTKGILTMSQAEQLFFASVREGYCLQDKIHGMLVEFAGELMVDECEVISYLFGDGDEDPSVFIELLVDSLS